MSKADKFAKLVRIKELRERKAMLILQKAEATLVQRKTVAENSRKTFDQKTEDTQRFAASQFMAMDPDEHKENFFTRFAVGLYHRKREVVAIGLRTRRYEADAAKAEKVRLFAQQTLKQERMKAMLYKDLLFKEQKSDALRDDLASEESILESLPIGAKN